MRIVDLTYDIAEGMPTFEAHWHPTVSIRQLGRLGMEGRETREVLLGTHTGTHVDAEIHFVPGGQTIDQVPLNRLIGPVSIVDFSGLGENGRVTVDMLAQVEVRERMLFRYGWSRFWGTRKYYHGYPSITMEAAKYLIGQGLKVIGYDTPSPDQSSQKLEGDDEDSPIHKVFLKNGVILIEYLTNLESIDPLDGWTLCVLPLRIRGADGSPARACVMRE